MARRSKTSPGEGLIRLVSVFPWWVGVALAPLIYLVLHAFAAPLNGAPPAPGQMGAFAIKTRRPRVRKGSELHLVQCKQWKAFKVGLDVVRQLYGVMAARGAAGGFVVTSGTFTVPASRSA